REESDRRAAAGEPFALRYRVPRGQDRVLRFTDSVYGEQQKLADEVEDFALLRSDGVPTYHHAGFLPQAFVNFLCLLGWSPKNDREFMSLDELTAAFTLEAVNRANAVINFSDDDPFDPKAVWLNAEHIRALPVDQLESQLQPFFQQAGLEAPPEKLLAVTPLIRERIKLLRDAVTAADFF